MSGTPSDSPSAGRSEPGPAGDPKEQRTAPGPEKDSETTGRDASAAGGGAAAGSSAEDMGKPSGSGKKGARKKKDAGKGAGKKGISGSAGSGPAESGPAGASGSAPSKPAAGRGSSASNASKKAASKKAAAAKPRPRSVSKAGAKKKAPKKKAAKKPLFKVGDKVVHPHHGAAVIDEVTEQDVAGEKRSYFVLKVAIEQLKVLMPVDTIDQSGIRSVISKTAANKVLWMIKNEDPQDSGSNWSRWYKVLNEKMTSGDIHQVAQVIRDLTHAQHTKGISPALKRMTSRARSALTSELAYVFQEDTDAAAARLEAALRQMLKRMGVLVDA